MEKNASDNVTYFLCIQNYRKNDLYTIRHWADIKVGIENDLIWISNLDFGQVNSIEVKSIPGKIIFYSIDGKLFLLGSQLPDRNVPALLWTPIERALAVKLPTLNHNYFGIKEEIVLKLIHSENEVETDVMIADIESVKSYIETAPKIRLENVKWVVLNPQKVLLFGRPFLPINGEAFWCNNDFLIPAGYELELYSMIDIINNLLNPDFKNYVLWDIDNTYSLINKNKLEELSISSFRKTYVKLLERND